MRPLLLRAVVVTVCTTLPVLLSRAQSTGPAPGPTWGTGPGALTPEPDGETIEIHDNQALVVMGRAGCPIAVVGHEVWNLVKQQKTAVKIPHTAKRDSLAALSDDGTILVTGKARNRDDHDSAADASVWNTQTGAKICDIPSSERELDMDYLGLAGNKYVLICARPLSSRKPAMEVWDANTGKLVRRFPCNFDEGRATTISPDGRYIAVADAEHLNVYDIATGQSVVSMPPPKDAPEGLSVNMEPGSVRVARTTMPFINMQSLAFSPDGSQLAGVSGAFDYHFLCWDHEAKLKENFILPASEFQINSGRPLLQWSPDSSAWLVNQHWLVDQKTHRALWEFPLAFADYPQTAFLDNSHLFVLHHGPTKGSEIVTIPWDSLHKAQSALARGPASALLAPGGKVSIEVTLVNVRGEETTTKNTLIAAATKALAASGITVAEGQPAVITLKLEEAAGPALPIVSHASPFDFHGQPTGRQASPAKGVLTLSIHARGSDTSLLSTTAVSESSVSSDHTITTSSLRESMLDNLAQSLERTTLPYYISKDNPPVLLPMGLPANKPTSSRFLEHFSSRGTLEEMASPRSRSPVPNHRTPPSDDKPPTSERL